ncbi:hypothetical protein FN846DRAFT_902710 [Sphaerosporella brunnea]|uniref:Uncharacterized protein n=1 Tax=Sphaerosporella brunnea TaxID=1250544 RepID=A0A5J5F9L3_9PEZI|nr:hypothetical protein FN846DRAFT_902710 [Sphaerosporella brunnea]
MFNLPSPRAFLSPPPLRCLEPIPAVSVVHQGNGKRRFLDYQSMTKQQREFLQSMTKKTKHTVPAGAYNLPIDFRVFLFEYKGGMPAVLSQVFDAADELWAAIDGIDAAFAAIKDKHALDERNKVYWLVWGPLKRMLTILKTLRQERPEELLQDMFAVEEWAYDVKAVTDEVSRCFLVTNRAVETVGIEKAAVLLTTKLKQIRLFRLAFEPDRLCTAPPDSREAEQSKKEVMENLAPALQKKVRDYVEELLEEQPLLS